eukprot:CAMPEP_0201594416 /NCGR_PEP_ID=MMETSP0190_2-20130828/191741_1 /ASSEMBLY_ACC=CAM_ASM_000263 /TAXON_ID=37353 /ORGANISM="Rosalina sp." /LENGTH=248 /DNA_ID=CAMNT_0048054025 /DNA_START=1106 /DNA_END=1852 /DNA_ORIENTATION=-
MLLPFVVNPEEWENKIIKDVQFKDDAFDTFLNKYFHEFTSDQALMSSMKQRESQQNQQEMSHLSCLSQQMSAMNEISHKENNTEVDSTNNFSIARDIASSPSPKKKGYGQYQWVSNDTDETDVTNVTAMEYEIEGQQDAIEPVEDIDEQESESEFDDGVIIDTTIKCELVEDGNIETTENNNNTTDIGWVYIPNSESQQIDNNNNTTTTSIIVENNNPPSSTFSRWVKQQFNGEHGINPLQKMKSLFS